MQRSPTMAEELVDYRPLIEVEVETWQEVLSRNGSNVDGLCGCRGASHDRLAGSPEKMAFMIILQTLRFICEPRAREPKMGIAALVQHGTRVVFCISFCSISVKSSDRRDVVLSVHRDPKRRPRHSARADQSLRI